VRDISERVRHEEALRQQAVSLAASAPSSRSSTRARPRQVDLERAMTARSRFYASMSHELRTPINAVLGYSTLLLERIYGPLNDKQVEGIERDAEGGAPSARARERRARSVEDRGGQDRLCGSSRSSFRRSSRTCSSPCGRWPTTTVDARRSAHDGAPIKIGPIRGASVRSCSTCLSNAIKFGAGKPIDVRCRARHDAGVVVEVTDQGDGIRPEDQERIFHEFVQLGKTQLQDGTGLGLPISRRLAERLDGSLTVSRVSATAARSASALPKTAEARMPRMSRSGNTARRVDERELRARASERTGESARANA
jgi:hypothetical protein